MILEQLGPQVRLDPKAILELLEPQDPQVPLDLKARQDPKAIQLLRCCYEAALIPLQNCLQLRLSEIFLSY